MSTFKCKMCGGTLELNGTQTVGTCEYCGTEQTLSKTREEVLQNLFNRANSLRMRSEFDKAQEIYEKIVSTTPDDAEAYWGIVLCKYGIEYVEDAATFKRIPTCHRTQIESVLGDAEYQSALEYASLAQKALYEKEAQEIDRLQKDILKIAAEEKPFDVFICYKETDENGHRTVDSTIANDIYYQLTTEGFKVFYAAITLEDKLGKEYEPYIFAALHSAKVMLVVGTKPDYFSAVWVKNEWSRYMKLMKRDRTKLLIPCYRDMDAYDLPEEFAHLQAQDMAKIGFINDLVRGIKKVMAQHAPKEAVKETIKETVVVSGGNANVAPLLERISMFLEDGEWASADEYCEKVLDQDPKNGEAYLGKLMAELHCRKKDALADSATPFDQNNNFQKARRFGDETLQAFLENCTARINERIRIAEMTKQYNQALAMKEKAQSEEDYRKVATYFARLGEFAPEEQLAANMQEASCLYLAKKTRYNIACAAKKNANTEEEYKAAAMLFATFGEAVPEGEKSAEEQRDECLQLADSVRKDAILTEARRLKRKNEASMDYDAIAPLERAVSLAKTIQGWRDADKLVVACEEKIADIKEMMRIRKDEEEGERLAAVAKAKKRKKLAAVLAAVLCVAIVFTIVLNTVILPTKRYNEAMQLLEAKQYQDAIEAFKELGDFKDSETQISEAKYMIATQHFEQKEYHTAITAFKALGNFKDSKSKMESAQLIVDQEKYDAACKLFEEKAYEEAIAAFKALGNFKDSETQISEAKYMIATQHFEQKRYSEAIAAFRALGNYKDSRNKMESAQTIVNQEEYDAACKLFVEKKYEKAIAAFEALGNYRDSAEKLEQSRVECQKAQLRNANVGDYVTFGAYEQDNNTSNGKEDIEWIVLDKKDGKLLVISKYALDCKQYNTSYTNVTWETCTLRTWLNDTFLNVAFSEAEKAMIPTVTVSADKNPDYSTNPGNATQDKVFLLSITEAEKYFKSDSARQCEATAYAEEQGAYVSSSNGNCWWWLRSPGFSQGGAASVDLGGDLIEGGDSVLDGNFAVRPALWIDLNS